MRPSSRVVDAGLPLLLGLAGALVLASCTSAPPATTVAAPGSPRDAPGTPVQGRPRITAKHAAPAEQATRRQLERLLDRYDLSPWRFTEAVEIEGGVIPHSHPVLTLSTRHLHDDLLLLSTYVHEQSHWYFQTHAESTRAAMAELESQLPGLPVGYPDGASDHDSSYEHLCVNAFEYEALRRLTGELVARQVLEFWATDHYRAIYRTVLDHDRAIRAVMKRHGLEPPAQAQGAAASP